MTLENSLGRDAFRCHGTQTDRCALEAKYQAPFRTTAERFEDWLDRRHKKLYGWQREFARWALDGQLPSAPPPTGRGSGKSWVIAMVAQFEKEVLRYDC